MNQKIREWTRRYLPAEIASSIATLVAAGLTHKLTGNQLTTALAGTWGGNVAYFGLILAVDIIQTGKKRRLINVPYTTVDLLKNIRALVLEFGVAEILDSFFIRPALMYYMPVLTGSLVLGILLAKIMADIIFYIPAIAGYELTRKHL